METLSGPSVPSGWYPDPMGRYQYRYWDGAVWTQYVTTNGRQYIDPLDTSPLPAAQQFTEAKPLEGPAPARPVRRWAKVVAAILVASAVYLLLGGLFLRTVAAPLANRLYESTDYRRNISLFLRDDAASSDVTALQQTILSDEERVARVDYVSKDEALKRFRVQMADSPEVLEGMEGNPLPASLEVTLNDPHHVEYVAASIKSDPLFPRVADNPDDPDESLKYAQQLLRELYALERGLAVLGLLLLLAAIVLGAIGAVLLASVPAPSRVKLVSWSMVAGIALFVITFVGPYAYFVAQLRFL